MLILAGVRMMPLLLNVFDGDEAAQRPVPVDDGEFFNPVLLEDFIRVVECRSDGGCDQVAVGHDLRYLKISVRLEAKVTIGHNTDQFSAVADNRNPGDPVLTRQFDRIADRLAGVHGDRIKDHPAFRTLDKIHLHRLLFDRHVLVEDSDPSFAGKGGGEVGLRHGVHRGGDERNVQCDIAGKPCGDVHLPRHHARFPGDEQDIIECQGVTDDLTGHGGALYTYAGIPVMSSPTISVCISCVPS